MKRAIIILFAVGWALSVGGDNRSASARRDLLWQYRNLGKAFYENPTTHRQAVEEFRKALALDPRSARDRLNYGLALLRAGRVQEGVAELERVQRQDPSIPETWFNLGIEFKRQGDNDRAIEQFQGMVRLVPDEPVSHYNLGYLYKLEGRNDLAFTEFETAAKLSPGLAGPHFQLYDAYHRSAREADASREYAIFTEIKRAQANAAVPEDLEWSPYAEIYDSVERVAEKTAAQPVKFEAHTVGKFEDAANAGLVVFDAFGNGGSDLVAWSSEGVRLFRNGVTPVANTGLEAVRGVVSIAPGDFNNDGLADLCILTNEGPELYINRKGSFERYPLSLPAGRFTKALWLDYDHDYDLDLFLLGDHSVLLRNEGKLGFRDVSARFPFVAGQVLDAAQFELHPDRQERDIVVTFADRPAVLYLDQQGGRYDARPLDAIPAGTHSIHALDANGDGWMDLVASTAAGLELWVNQGGKLQDTALSSHPEPHIGVIDFDNDGAPDLAVAGSVLRNVAGRFTLETAGIPDLRAVAAADFTGDGRVDLAVITPDGSVKLLSNRTASAHHWIGVHLAGVKNLHLAPGATVEVKAGTVYGKQIYEGVPLVFGLRNRPTLDTIRITWPNGLVQNEIEPPVDRLVSYVEKPRLSGSCPMIFTWNGSRFEFTSDVLGVAPLGASDGDGHYFAVNHREYVKIPAGHLRAINGSYELRISEELHEVSYLDRIQLIAVDHPAKFEVFTNDKFKSPPFPPFRMFQVGRKIRPRSATDQNGRDILSEIGRQDGVYAAGFRRDSAGVAETHWIDLDFGDAAPDNRAILVLNGWVDWADGSTFLGASQEGRGLVFPYLQVKDAHGHWQTVIDDMGMPSGKPRTIVVDLAGKFLSRSRAIRIVTNLCVYWDEIYLSEDSTIPKPRLTPLAAAEADLHFRGFSQWVVDPNRTHPEVFLYSRVTPFSSWNPIPGLYTRYGEVRSLLLSEDDRMVVMGSGDELRLRFNPSGLPALPLGWARDFFVSVSGWAKDGDSNTAFSHSVEPLPFEAMSTYPYPAGEHFPDDEIHRSYRAMYLTRPALRLLRPLAEDRAARRDDFSARPEVQRESTDSTQRR